MVMNNNRNWLDNHATVSKNILEQEYLLANNIISKFTGYRFMSLGTNADERLIKCFDHSHKFCFNSSISNKKCNSVASFSHLPLPSESVDCILLQHVLEFSCNPQSIISEISRIIVSGGNLLIFIINPLSPLGLNKYLVNKYSKRNDISYSPLRVKRIMDWLTLLNFDVDVVIKENSNCDSTNSSDTYEKGIDYKSLPMKTFKKYSERLFYNTYLIHGVKRRNAGIRVPKTEWKLSTQNKVNLTETLKLKPKIKT